MIRTTITVFATYLLPLCANSRGTRSFPLAGHAELEQNTVVGFIAVLLALLGNMLRKAYLALCFLYKRTSPRLSAECLIMSPSQKMTL
jgi:hypothetical protein